MALHNMIVNWLQKECVTEHHLHYYCRKSHPNMLGVWTMEMFGYMLVKQCCHSILFI